VCDPVTSNGTNLTHGAGLARLDEWICAAEAGSHGRVARRQNLGKNDRKARSSRSWFGLHRAQTQPCG
jgi:hypothetical protein